LPQLATLLCENHSGEHPKPGKQGNYNTEIKAGKIQITYDLSVSL
jgi:hypothetical protein